MNAWNKTVFACLTLAVLAFAPFGSAKAQVRVTAATPSSTYQGTVALDVVVSGSGFDPSAKVQYFVTGTTNPGGISVRKVSFRSSKELVTTIDVSDAALLAYYDIQVTLDSGRKGKGTTLFSVRLKNGTTDSYIGESLGVLPGAKQSDAWDVNAAGHVVGRSYQPMRGYYWDGTMHELPGSAAARNTPPFTVAWEVEATAISGGPAEVAVGYESRMVCDSGGGPCDYQQYPLFWDGDLGRGPDAQRLDAGEGTATGINTAGTMAVGYCGGGAGAVWARGSTGWTRNNIPLGAFVCDGCVYESGNGWDVNDTGLVIGSVTRQDDYRSFAYVYDTQASRGLVLPIPPGFLQSNVYAVSNVAGGKVYLAGWIGSCASQPCSTERGIRWNVDVATLAASYEILVDTAWAEGVTDQGFVAGTHNSEPNRRGNVTQTAVLWKQTSGYIQLKPPTGSDSASRAMAAGPDGTVYVVGHILSKGVWTSGRWVIP
jgi:hypothetical protein